MATFEGLLKLNFIEITHELQSDLQTMKGTAIRFIARDELLDRLNQLDGHPAISLTPDLNSETILLRDRIDGDKERIQWTERSDLWFKTVNP